MKQCGNETIESGFTFIELIIAVAIISLILPMIFGLLFVNLQAQSKVLILQEVKRQGDNTLNVMEELIKQYGADLYSDATLTTRVCDTAGATYSGPLYIKDKMGNYFRFYVPSGETRIASESAKSGSGGADEVMYLTSVRTSVVPGNLSVSCSRAATFNSPLVAVSFTITELGVVAARHEQSASLNYQTKIKLRSF